MLPATKLYSDRSRAPDATHEVSREHEYKDATDPDALVPPEERQKAYKVASLPPCAAPCLHSDPTFLPINMQSIAPRTAGNTGCFPHRERMIIQLTRRFALMPDILHS